MNAEENAIGRGREKESSPKTLRALTDALASVLPVHRLTYQHHWFAGLSELPGDGLEHVDLVRNGANFVGSVKIQFRAGLSGATASCSCPISIEARHFEALFQAVGSAKPTYGTVSFVAPDVADRRHLSFQANGGKLTFVRGLGGPNDFWGYAPDDEFASWDFEISGIRCSELSAIGALLDQQCGLSVQTTSLWNGLKNWPVHRRGD